MSLHSRFAFDEIPLNLSSSMRSICRPAWSFLVIFLCLFSGLHRAVAAEVSPLSVIDTFPEPGALHEFNSVEIHFSDSVTGVDAADLLANGFPCSDVRRVSPDVYVFTLPTLPLGNIDLTWKPGTGITDFSDPPNSFPGTDRLEYILLPPTRPGGVILSEIVPDNKKTIRDEEGDYEDWIELQNITDADVPLLGWHLTDAPEEPMKWTFPDITLPARGFLVVFASAKDRTSPTNRLHTNFKLKSGGQYLGLTAPDGIVVNDFAPHYPATPANIAFGRANGDPDQTGFFAIPTPGAANSTAGSGFAPAINFSIPGGLVTVTNLNLLVTLSLAEASPNTVIRYTLDGRLPTEITNGFTYTEPIRLLTNNAVMLRARAFRSGYIPGPVHTEVYTPMFVSTIRLTGATNEAGIPLQRVVNPNIQQFRSDLPLLVINTFGRAPNETANLIVQFNLYETKNGVASVTNPPDFSTRGGMKIRGSSSASLNKKQYAVQWTDDYNQDRDLPVLGMPGESEWVLYAPNDFEPVSIHNPFIHQLARDIGEYSPRTRFVEIFINRSGPLTTNQYDGLYVLMEKPGLGKKRIPGPKLQPEDNTFPDITGTYAMKIDRVDPGDSGISAGGQSIAMIAPKEKELKQAARVPQRKYLTDYLNAMNKGFTPANRRDPTNSYVNYIEMNKAIDYHIIEALSGSVDTMVLSAYFYKPRNQKLIFGPHWDFDRALGSTDGRDAIPRSWNNGPVFSSWFGPMFGDVEAWQLWVDRFQQLRTNQLSIAHTYSLMDQLANQIRQAERRDFQRWKIARRGGSYQAELDSMKRWVSNKLDFVDRQLAQPPVASLLSGLVASGTPLTLTPGPGATANAAIWYTLDGTDPRALGVSNPSPSAVKYTGPLTLTSDVRFFARVLDTGKRQAGGPSASSPWSGPTARTYVTQHPALTLTEIQFHPDDADSGQSYSPNDFEFLEFKNTSGGILNLAGYSLSGEVAFTFGSKPSLKLAPHARFLLVANTNAFAARYGKSVAVAGEFAGHLNDTAGRLRLTGPAGNVLFDFSYADDWVNPADGDGYSMVLRSEALEAFDIDTPSAWVASANLRGSPGQPDAASDVGPDTDSDGDGLPDAWERTYFGNLSATGATDSDGDGYTNREEFLAGTRPDDATSKPRLDAVPSPFGGNPVLRFPRNGARSYRLLYQNSLADTNWQELLRFPAKAGDAFGEFRDLTTTNRTRFYRLTTP